MSASPPLTPHTRTRSEPTWALTVAWAALAWSAAVLGLGLGWLSGVIPRGVPDGEVFGSLFTGRSLGVASAVALGFGLVGVACALLLLRRGAVAQRLAEAGSWVMSGAVLVVFVDGSLLAWMGCSMIVPFLGWFVPGLGAAYVETSLAPTHLTLLFFAFGVVLWALAALTRRRVRFDACQRCGRIPGWTPGLERLTRVRSLRVGRYAVAAGVVLALLYPALRLPWLFGVAVGFTREEFAQIRADGSMVAVGVGLGSAGVVGALLMLGLVQRWGTRFPWWMAGLAGRRVPVPVAVVPAALVVVGLVSMGRSITVQLLTLPPDSALVGDLVHTVVFQLMLLWGVALAVAAAAYVVRRRAECAECGRGLPEAAPGDIRAVA